MFPESIAYTFGHHGGLIVYSFPDHELPDARHDQLAFGLMTTQRTAVLVRVVSGSSSDFIELELVRHGKNTLAFCGQRTRAGDRALWLLAVGGPPWLTVAYSTQQHLNGSRFRFRSASNATNVGRSDCCRNFPVGRGAVVDTREVP
jgi:hypothetical protein